MHRGREARLARRLAGITEEAAARACHRDALKALVAVGAAVRDGLSCLGIDPGSATRLRALDEAAAELAALPDDEAGRAGGRRQEGDRAAPPAEDDWLDPETLRLVARYRDGTLPDPDPAHASLAELFAWCLARLDDAGTTEEREFAVDSL